MFDQIKVMRDYGKRNAIKNEFLIIPSKFREDRATFNTIMGFIIEQIPNLIKSKEPIPIVNFKDEIISPYDQKINSFIKNNPSNYYPKISDLIKDIDKDKVLNVLNRKNIELIGIDESRVEMPLQGSRFAYLKSIAFRMSKKNDVQDEVVGPIVRDFEVSFEDSPIFEKKIQFWGYLRNLYVAYLVIYNAVKSGYSPVVFLHGPLIRNIGPFTDIFLTKEDAIKILSISELDDFEDSIFFQDEEGRTLIYGEKLLEKFHEEEVNNRDLIYEDVLKKMDEDIGEFDKWKESLPFNKNKNPIKLEDRKLIPGLSLYMWLINRLYLLCKKYEVPLASVVENIESSTEFVQYVLPPLFKMDPSLIPTEIVNIIGRKLPPNTTPIEKRTFPKELYKYIFKMIKKMNITDSVVTSCLLDEGEYTTPIRTCRYLTRDFFDENWGHMDYGIKNVYKSIINYYFNPKEKRVLSSFLRTTPIREPIRVEFFDIYGDDYHNLLGATFLLSLFYPYYGLPIILKYVDQIARTHKEYPQKILEYVIMDALMAGDFNIEDVLIISKKLSRNFWSR